MTSTSSTGSTAEGRPRAEKVSAGRIHWRIISLNRTSIKVRKKECYTSNFALFWESFDFLNSFNVLIMPEKIKLDLSIVIINYNTNNLTCQCIKSIIAETNNISYEIIVVDNDSRKEDPNYIKYTFKEITLVKNNKNIGFAGGNNLGISISKSKFILLLNSDTIIQDSAIEKCFLYLKANLDSVSLLSCKLLNEDKSFQLSTSGREPKTYSFFMHMLYELQENNPFLYHLGFYRVLLKFKNTIQSIKAELPYSYENDIFNTMHVSGAFMMFPVNLLHKVGSLDNDFFMYYEETEWLHRMWNKGHKIVYYPHVSIIHLGGSSGGSQKMVAQKIISKTLMYYKLSGLKGYILINIVNAINFICNVIAIPFLGKNGRMVSIGFIKNYPKVLSQLFTIPMRYNRDVSTGCDPLISNDLEPVKIYK